MSAPERQLRDKKVETIVKRGGKLMFDSPWASVVFEGKLWATITNTGKIEWFDKKPTHIRI